MKFEDIEFGPHHFATEEDKAKHANVGVGKYQLSVINGQHAYCSDGNFEVAILDENNDFVDPIQLLGEDFVASNDLSCSADDTPIGYCEPHVIEAIVERIEEVQA